MEILYYNGQTMFRKQQMLLEDPGIAYPIDDFGLSFREYTLKCRQIIAQYRQDLHTHRDLKIDANCPFELPPDKPFEANQKRYGALLIHGLFDSPFVMREIGAKLSAQGLLVRSILLPGHGTVPGALLNVSYESWLQSLRYGISTFAKEVDQLFLVGFSTGATLSVYQSLLAPSDFIAGLILLSPAFQIKSKFAFISPWAVAAGKIIERAKWLHIEEEIDYVKYRSIAFNAVVEIDSLMKKIKTSTTSSREYPQFCALSLNDQTIESSACLNYFSSHTHPKNRLVLYAEKNPLPKDPRIILRPTSYPAQRIEAIAHIAIPISPSNPHYGIQGDYPFASHTQTEPDHCYVEMSSAEISFYRLLYRFKLTKYLRQRLTFNPDFEFLMQSMSHFIDSVVSD